MPFVFILSEYLISNIFSGFPWVTFSLTISSLDFLMFLPKNFGTLVTSYLVIIVFCLPYLFFFKKIKYNFTLTFLLVTPLLISILINNYQNVKIKEDNFSVRYFQLNFPIKDKSSKSKQNFNEIINLIKYSDEEILIFAENNFPYIIKDKEFDELQKIIKENQTVIIGSTRLSNGKYYNSLFNITKTKITIFDKKHLVPFGEYLPLRDLFNSFEPISGTFDFSQGNYDRLIYLNKKISYIPVICYEIIFYSKLINKTNIDSNFIINITNDAWFGKNLGPTQHFYLTKLRAAEFNKTIIRVSNNGISGIISNDGKIIKQTNLNQITDVSSKIILKNKKNFYFTHKYLNYYFCFLTLLLIIFNFFKLYANKKTKL